MKPIENTTEICELLNTLPAKRIAVLGGYEVYEGFVTPKTKKAIVPFGSWIEVYDKEEYKEV